MMRIAAAVLLLAASAPAMPQTIRSAMPGPPPAATTMPRFSGDVFVTADGERLPLRRWLPQGPPRAVILALHGFNDYSQAFAEPAMAWAREGIATYAHDQRGFGAAPGRGRWWGTEALAADALAASGILRRRYPGVPLYLLGKSMGGAVAIVAVTGAAGLPAPAVDGVILAAPAVQGRATMGLLPCASRRGSEYRAGNCIFCPRTILRCCARWRAIRWSSSGRGSMRSGGLSI